MERKLQINGESFNQNLHIIEITIINITNYHNFIDAKFTVLNVSEQLLSSLILIEDELNDRYYEFYNCRLRSIHISIIPPDFVLQLRLTSKSLRTNNMIVLPYLANIAKYFYLIELQTYQNENKIVFILPFPLVES